jgi:uncharacterized membrane protein YedE/YeeE
MDALFPTGFAHFVAGGLFIGLGVGLLYVLTGRVGGMSTLLTACWSWVSSRRFFHEGRFVETREWRLAYAVGLVAGAACFLLVTSGEGAFVTGVQWWRLALGGVLVGFGARWSGGCTSGHGVCGLGGLQGASLAAVVTFMAVGILVARLVGMLGVAP